MGGGGSRLGPGDGRGCGMGGGGAGQEGEVRVEGADAGQPGRGSRAGDWLHFATDELSP